MMMMMIYKPPHSPRSLGWSSFAIIDVVLLNHFPSVSIVDKKRHTNRFAVSGAIRRRCCYCCCCCGIPSSYFLLSLSLSLCRSLYTRRDDVLLYWNTSSQRWQHYTSIDRPQRSCCSRSARDQHQQKWESQQQQQQQEQNRGRAISEFVAVVYLSTVRCLQTTHTHTTQIAKENPIDPYFSCPLIVCVCVCYFSITQVDLLLRYYVTEFLFNFLTLNKSNTFY